MGQCKILPYCQRKLVKLWDLVVMLWSSMALWSLMAVWHQLVVSKQEQGGCSAQSGSEEGGLSSQVLAVSDSSCGHHLLGQLALPREGLGQCESQQLEELLCKAGDVFALDDSELGCTSLVQHRVDTGGYPAIKQYCLDECPFHREGGRVG